MTTICQRFNLIPGRNIEVAPYFPVPQLIGKLLPIFARSLQHVEAYFINELPLGILATLLDTHYVDPAGMEDGALFFLEFG